MTLGRDTLVGRIWAHAEARPDDLFVRAVGADVAADVTWRALREGAARFARGLGSGGVGRGDVVLIFLPHSEKLFAPFFGAMALGAVPSFMPTPSVKQESSAYWAAHAALFARIQPKVVLTDDRHRAAMEASLGASEDTLFLTLDEVLAEAGGEAGFRPVAAPDDVALLQHSSGTTGLKKGVALSHRAIAAQLDAYGAALRIRPDDVVASWLPVYHDMGLVACTLLPAWFGLTTVSIDPFVWLSKPRLIFDAIEDQRATLAWMPNFAFQHLIRAAPPRRTGPKDLSSLRALIDCSEVCQAATLDAFAETFAEYGLGPERLQVCYAAAETVFAITQTAIGVAPRAIAVDDDALRRGEARLVAPDEPGVRRVLSCGRPIDGLSVTILDDDGAALAERAVGEVAVAGASLFDGYFGLPEVTAKKLRDGRYLSGDLGFLHEGELYLLGRKDDVIIVNGRNYMAPDLEAAAGRVAGLKPGRAVALGVYDGRLGSSTICIVAERDSEAAAGDDERLSRDLRQALLDQADAAAADVRIVAPGWLAKTTSGKISRSANLDRYLALRDAERAVPAA